MSNIGAQENKLYFRGFTYYESATYSDRNLPAKDLASGILYRPDLGHVADLLDATCIKKYSVRRIKDSIELFVTDMKGGGGKSAQVSEGDTDLLFSTWEEAFQAGRHILEYRLSIANETIVLIGKKFKKWDKLKP